MPTIDELRERLHKAVDMWAEQMLLIPGQTDPISIAMVIKLGLKPDDDGTRFVMIVGATFENADE